MPELPEVENIKKGLKALEGQTISKVFVFQPKTVSGKGAIRKSSSRKVDEFVNELKGESIKSVERRGKNLIFRMKSGKLVLAHLKMTGQFLYDPTRKTEPSQHTRIYFELTKGNLLFNDARRFGYVLYFPDAKSLDETGHFEKIGLEPLEKGFTVKYLEKEFSKNKSSLKSVLMGQKVVAGLGNIYADEAAFLAGIHPLRKVNTLSKAEIKELYREIKDVLRSAIKHGGSSIRNYRKADGSQGKFSARHNVYGREGKGCLVCGEKLSKMIVGSRTTVFCKNCQK